MRKLLKFLHTLATIGFVGALGALIVLHLSLPEPSELQRFAAVRIAMGALAEWVLLPSMGLVLVSGLLAMAVTPAFQEAGWVWAKLATGILVFEGTLAYVQAPMERAAQRARLALEGGLPAPELGATLGPEWGSFWVLLLVGVANVALGIWRPRFTRSGGSTSD
jgi:uncharacterized membrane protein